jgi:hypothetical protein
MAAYNCQDISGKQIAIRIFVTLLFTVVYIRIDARLHCEFGKYLNTSENYSQLTKDFDKWIWMNHRFEVFLREIAFYLAIFSGFIVKRWKWAR